jgi:hypothetical protein
LQIEGQLIDLIKLIGCVITLARLFSPQGQDQEKNQDQHQQVGKQQNP